MNQHGNEVFRTDEQTPNYRVAIGLAGHIGMHRAILRGIGQFASSHAWDVFGKPDTVVAPVKQLETFPGDGMIVHLSYKPDPEPVLGCGLPLVDIGSMRCDLAVPRVCSDDRAIGQLAAEHLLDRGFTNLAYCGIPGHGYSDLREASFRKAVLARGQRIHLCTQRPPLHGEWSYLQMREGLKAWLRDLPRPVGIMACNDTRARHITEACRELQLPIPDEVAVVGVDDDDLLCRMLQPPLTSVAINAERIGYTAAELLQKLMSGGSTPTEPIRIQPIGMIERRSTEVLAIADAYVRRAVQFIRTHSCKRITAADVLQQIPLSRRAVERRFRGVLGRTIQQEIRRMRLNEARRLLRNTDWPLEQIADRSGFGSAKQLSTIFRQVYGTTASRYRQQMRETQANRQ